MTLEEKLKQLERLMLETADLLHEVSFDEDDFFREQMESDYIVTKLDGVARAIRSYLRKKDSHARD